MDGARTNGMRAIGVASIIIGTMFGLIGLLMAIVGGGFIPFSDQNAAGLAGEFVMICGIGTVVANAALVGGGVGVLRVAPWGRGLCIAHAALAGIVYGAWLIGGDLDMFFVAALVYAGILIWLFYRTSWKDAFTGGAVELARASSAVSSSVK